MSLEQFVGQFDRGQSLAVWSRWLVLGALAVWVAASVLAVLHVARGRYSRAGAVGTALVLWLRNDMRNHGNLPMPPDGPPETVEVATCDHDHNLEVVARLYARLHRDETRARGVEVLAVVLATLQWGYGDLVMNRTTACGDWMC